MNKEDFNIVALVKACAKKKDLCNGTRLHDEILERGLLTKSPFLASTLISMYARCGVLVKAQNVLEELPIRDSVTWSALIVGYAQQGCGHEALSCFEQMKSEGFSPNAITFTGILKACGNVGSINKGEEIHKEIVSRGLMENNIVLCNALVDMYAKCGVLNKAEQVLKELRVRDVISWSSLIAGYAHHGQGEEALHCLQQMHNEGLPPNAITYVCILKACGSIGAIDKGKHIHEEIMSTEFLDKDVVLGNALVDMYAKCGVLEMAQQVFERLPCRDVVSWSTLISGYTQQGQYEIAFNCFERMQGEGISPNEVTFICILKACGGIGDIDKGKKIHDEILNRGLLEEDIVLGTALVDMYARCGSLSKARQVLEELSIRDTVSWSALIAGYAQQGQYHEALNCFERMQTEGISPNVVTFSSILKACSSTGAIGKGQQIHEEISSKGLLKKEVVLGTSLVDMYAKFGMLTKAQKVLKELLVRDIISWNSLIAGYVQQGQCNEAFKCLEQVKREGFSPNAITFIYILQACCIAGAFDKGKQTHEEIMNSHLMETNIALGNALVDMYAKCGAPSNARQVFEELNVRNVISWNALIAGYAQQGQVHEALNCFEQMQCEGLSPDEVTFLSLMSGYGHLGQLNDAQIVFENMTRKYGIAPNLDHHTCLVVVFGFAGHFDMAISVITVMPSSDYLPVWLALLGACRKWANVKLGKLAFNQAVQLDNGYSAAYILMANIFAAAGMKEDAEMVEAMKFKYDYSKEQENIVQADISVYDHLFFPGIEIL